MHQLARVARDGEEVAVGRLAIPDTEVAAQQFLDLFSGPVLKRMLFAVTPAPDQAMAEQQVERALAMFYSAYGPKVPSV